MARTPGSLNRRTQDVINLLARLKCNPLEGMARIALNELPCGVCRGVGRSKYMLPEGQHSAECATHSKHKCDCEGIGERVCQSCYGTTFEACSPDLRGKMYAELCPYLYPRLKSVEHKGAKDDAGTKIQIVFVQPPQPAELPAPAKIVYIGREEDDDPEGAVQ